MQACNRPLGYCYPCLVAVPVPGVVHTLSRITTGIYWHNSTSTNICSRPCRLLLHHQTFTYQHPFRLGPRLRGNLLPPSRIGCSCAGLHQLILLDDCSRGSKQFRCVLPDSLHSRLTLFDARVGLSPSIPGSLLFTDSFSR